MTLSEQLGLLAPVALDLLEELFLEPVLLHQGSVDALPQYERQRAARRLIYGEQLVEAGFARVDNAILSATHAGMMFVLACRLGRMTCAT